jgi:AraC family transcriptional regulator
MLRAMTDLAPPPLLATEPLERARLHIEARLFEPLSLGQLAGAAGLSAYHFTRQFGARFGQSPMAYVRARRLTAAADRLCGGAPPSLIDLAFDCGFDSQECFTRAFKRVFGIPPGLYRRASARTSPPEIFVMPDSTETRIQLSQAPLPVRKGRLRIAGFAANFNDTDKAGIPKLWDRLVECMPLEGGLGETFGVCSAAAGSEPGSMRYMAGVHMAADAPAPAGLEMVDLPPQSYLIFRQVMDGGPLQPQMLAAAREIWGERLPKSGHKLAQAPDLEFYPADSTPDQAGAWVEWWVPVEDQGA